MNAEVAEAGTWTETGTEVGLDAGVTLAIEDGRRREAVDQAAAIRGTLTGEKGDVSVVRREATSGQTAPATPVVAETLVTSTGEEMTACLQTVAMVLEMALAEESHQEVDHHHRRGIDVHHAETTNLLEVRLEVASPLLVITDVMTAEAPILGLTIDFRLINLNLHRAKLDLIYHSRESQ